MADELFLQPGEIEVFRAGDHPQGKWSPERVARAAANYDPVNKHRAYIKAGHKDGGMAYGLFDKMRAVGGSLIGKLAEAVPKPVKDAFAQGQLSGWSSEFYTDYEGTGEPYFKALALLGATPPQIKGLKSAIDFKELPDHGPVESFDMSPAPTPVSKLFDALDRATKIAKELYDEVSTHNEEENPVADPKQPVADPAKPAPAPAAPAATTDTAKFAEMEQKFAELKAQNEALATEVEKQKGIVLATGKSVLKGKIDSFAEQAKKDGKLIEGDVLAGVASFMEAIEPVFFEVDKTDKDGKVETDKVNALAWFKEHVGRRLTAVPTGVESKKAARSVEGRKATKVAEGATPDSIDLDAAVEAYAEEHKITYTQAFPIVAAQRASA